MHEIVKENAQEIARLLEEVSTKYNGTQICNDATRVIRQNYRDKIYVLSDWHVQLEMYLSDTNIESGRYKITVRCDDAEDKAEIAKYWEQVKG